MGEGVRHGIGDSVGVVPLGGGGGCVEGIGGVCDVGIAIGDGGEAGGDSSSGSNNNDEVVLEQLFNSPSSVGGKGGSPSSVSSREGLNGISVELFGADQRLAIGGGGVCR